VPDGIGGSPLATGVANAGIRRLHRPIIAWRVRHFKGRIGPIHKKCSTSYFDTNSSVKGSHYLHHSCLFQIPIGSWNEKGADHCNTL
jgi:hypothetical protein